MHRPFFFLAVVAAACGGSVVVNHNGSGGGGGAGGAQGTTSATPTTDVAGVTVGTTVGVTTTVSVGPGGGSVTGGGGGSFTGGGGSFTGGTGGGTGGGPNNCLHCADAVGALHQGMTPMDVCPASRPLLDVLSKCACGGACKTACAPTLCAVPLLAPDAACVNCVSAPDSPGPGCESELMACTADT
jgi:hypothetical protein